MNTQEKRHWTNTHAHRHLHEIFESLRKKTSDFVAICAIPVAAVADAVLLAKFEENTLARRKPVASYFLFIFISIFIIRT